MTKLGVYIASGNHPYISSNFLLLAKELPEMSLTLDMSVTFLKQLFAASTIMNIQKVVFSFE